MLNISVKPMRQSQEEPMLDISRKYARAVLHINESIDY